MLYTRSSAPAELPKQASSFDLPIAMGLLAASGQVDSDLFDRCAVAGPSVELPEPNTMGLISLAALLWATSRCRERL